MVINCGIPSEIAAAKATIMQTIADDCGGNAEGELDWCERVALQIDIYEDDIMMRVA